MIALASVLAALKTQRERQQTELDRAYTEIDCLVRSVFEHLPTDKPEASRLLTAAMDLAHDIGAGDTVAELFDKLGLDDGAGD